MKHGIISSGIMVLWFASAVSCSHNKSNNADDSVSRGVVQPVAITASPTDEDFIGEYTDPHDGSTLKIDKSTNSRPSVEIGLFRLTDIDDGIGRFTDGKLTFTATDAAGNPIQGKISLDGNIAVLEFTESTWSYLPNGTTYRFKRDTATMKQE